ncbi:hypothetical protein BBJ28_00025039, partial [Nothophytophthora sp. Chile5]
MPPDLREIPAAALDCCHDGATELLDPREFQRAVQRAGRALRDVLASASAGSLSSECHEALECMAESGKSLELRFVNELQNAGVLAKCAKLQTEQLRGVSLSQLSEMREAIAACATATLTSTPAVELLALWSVVHNSVSDVVITVEAAALAATAGQNASDVLEAVDDVGGNMVAIGKLLLTALSSSAAFASPVSDDLQTAIKQLAEAGTPVAENLTHELQKHLADIQKVLSDANWEELRSRCGQSLTSHWQALGAAANKVTAPATAAVGMAQVAVNEIFDSPLAKAITAQGFTGLEGTLGQSRDAVNAALDAARDGGVTALSAFASCLTRSGLPPLLRVEIARDFFQTVGLFFAGLYAPVLDYFERQHVISTVRSLLNGLRGAYDVMAVSVLALIQEASQHRALMADVAVVLLLVAIGAVYASFLWFAFSARHLHRRADEVRQGHEATTWAALAAKQKLRVRLFTYVITACLTVYLPLTRLCLDVIMAAATDQSNAEGETTSASGLVVSRFKDSSFWPVVVAVSVLLLLTFTLPLPWLLVRAVAENRPTGSLENPLVTHDLDGEQVPFDDKVYARLVTRDPSQLHCPYRSLYAGFEQRWSYYKVLQLLVKLALALVIVVAANADARIRGAVSCVIYAGVVALTSYGTPFSDPLNNVMEVSGKVAALTTCIGGALAAFVGTQKTTSRTLELVAVVVSIVHIVNLFVMLVVLLLGMRAARLFLKNCLGWLTFSDTSRGLEDAPARSVLPHWDLEKEAKHRVWQAFWRSVLLEMTQDNSGSKGDVKEFTVAHRLEALEQAVVASGVRRVRSHWRGEEHAYTSKLRQATRAALEGVDVFWDDASGARDGRLDSKSCFGKMYVLPYPFHCVVVYDDAKDETIIRDDIDDATTFDSSVYSKLAKLLFLNFTPRIVAKRELRQKLRVLSAHNTSVHFPFSRQETATVEDGTIQKTDANGNTTTETRYSTVTFTCYYTQGVLHVATKGDTTGRVMAEGFDVSMTYRDGYGDAVAPHTGKVHHLQNRVTVMGPDHVGLTPAMDESDQLRVIFEQTRGGWEQGLIQLQASHQEYRRALERKHAEANATLSDAFWYFVYNNPRLPREELEHHLRRRERNPRMHSLTETHQSVLDALYLRMNFVQSHPAITFWYVFWDDVYARNGEMTRLRKCRRDLNPREPTAICYHVMRRHELEVWLRERR